MSAVRVPLDEMRPAVVVTPEFRNQLRVDMRTPAAWAVHLEPENIHRTEAALRWMIRSIENQIKVHGSPEEEGYDPDWYRRASGLRNLLQERLNQVMGLIDTVTIRRKDYEKMRREIGALRDFAWDLCVELEAVGEEGVRRMHTIDSPVAGRDALEWLEIREAAALAAEQAQQEEQA